MKDLIRNILREEVAKNTNIERYLNPLKKYIAMRSLPDSVCFTSIVLSENIIIVMFRYNRVMAKTFEEKIQSEIKKVFNTNNIYVTSFFTDEKTCEENLERLLNNDDHNKKFFLIPNKNYNP
jgi:capsule polysaccharide modification protein KpsS